MPQQPLADPKTLPSVGATLDVLTTIIAVIDFQGVIVMVNETWRRFADDNGLHTPHDGVGENYLAVCDAAVGDWSEEAPQVAQGIREVLAGKRREFYLEYPCHGPDVERWFVLRATRLLQGTSVYAVVAHEDITARIRAENQARELVAEKERAKVLQQFVADASHDFRTPLTAIGISLYMLRRVCDSEAQQQHLDKLEGHAARLNKLVENLLEITRLDMSSDLEFEVLDVNELLEVAISSIQATARDKGLSVRLAPPTERLFVQGNVESLSHAVGNILENALRHTLAEGTITTRAYAQDQRAVIEVRDTGIGIGPNDLPHIFDRFYRADAARNMNEGATGLGLPIAKRIIEIHAGQIAVESTLGKGTMFRLSLPMAAEKH